MTALLIALVALAGIGFMWGGFMAFVVFLIALILGYFTGVFGILFVVLVVFAGSIVYKFGVINLIKRR